jgi:uncharacterized protein (DUF2461 family)
MEKSTMHQAVFFLKHLEKNNNREWFAENKDTYILAQNNIITLRTNTTHE